MGDDEDKKKKKGGKCGSKKMIWVILAPILVVVLGAAMFFAVLEGIVELILKVLGDILNAIIDFLKNPIKWIGKVVASFTNFLESHLIDGNFDPDEYENARPNLDATIEISQSVFEDMRDSLDAAVDRDAAGVGLDDIMLKKMLLAYYSGVYFDDTNIIIELSKEDLVYILLNGDQCIEPFEVKEGDEDEGFGSDDVKYLCGRGKIDVKLYNSSTDIIYYPTEMLKKIYDEEYKVALNKNKTTYANSVLEYLKKCYDYSDSGGIKIYAENGDKKSVTWEYENMGSAVNLDDGYNDKNISFMNVEYVEKISQFATPVEFMVDLMEITGSTDFLNTFIKAMVNQTSIKMELCTIEYTETEIIETESDRETTIKGTKSGIKYTAQRDDGTTDGLTVSQEHIGSTDYINIIIEDTNAREQNTTSTVTLIGDKSGNEVFNEQVTLDETNDWQHSFKSPIELTADEKEKTDNSKVTITETTTYHEEKYDLMLKEVKNWYVKITQQNDKKIYTEYSTINKEGDEVQIDSPESAEKIQIDDGELTYTRDSNPEIFLNYINAFNQLKVIQSLGGKVDRACCMSALCGYVACKNENIFDTFEYNYHTLNIKDTNSTKSTVWILRRVTFDKVSTNESDNSDMFLALLSGPDSKYEIGDKFVAKANGGKVIKYLDSYKGSEEKTVTLEDGSTITSKYGIVGAGELLENGAQVLFDLLERSTNTQGLVDTMKWIMYRYSGKDYGVTEFKFVWLDPESMTEQSKTGNSYLMEYLHAIDGTSNLPESSDGTKYIVYDDNGTLKVGHGVEINSSDNKFLFIKSGYELKVGEEIDKDFVDELEEKEVKEIVEEVKEKTKNLDLTEYQIHALVARVKAVGKTSALGRINGKTFEDAYNEYWNQNSDDKYGERSS